VAYSVSPGLSRSDSVRLWSMIDIPVRFRLGLGVSLVVNDM
jgi:hypothetical protein